MTSATISEMNGKKNAATPAANGAQSWNGSSPKLSRAGSAAAAGSASNRWPQRRQ